MHARTPDRSRPITSIRQRIWPGNVSKGLLLLRLVVGLLFVAHALQKILGWFGGPGMTAWTESVAKLGLRPASFWAPVEAAGELGGGILLVLGLFTAAGAALIVGDMVVATYKVHLAKGLFAQEGGFEYNLVLAAILVAIGLMGPGLYAFDRRLPFAQPRPATFLVALAVTLAIAVAALLGFGPGFGPATD